MLCFSRNSVKTDDDPHERPKIKNSSGRRSMIKRAGDRIKKWIKKPKNAPPNPIPGPYLGRRAGVEVDLNKPLPFYKAMHELQFSSPNKKPPSDPKNKIIFSTSRAFVRIEEVVPPPNMRRIGGQRPGGLVGMVRSGGDLEWRPNLIGRSKVEVSRAAEPYLNQYTVEEPDSDEEEIPRPHQGIRIGSPVHPSGASLPSMIQEDIPLLQDGKLLRDKGKGIILYESESETESEEDEADFSPASSSGTKNEEIPALGMEEAVEDIGQVEEEIPVQGISREATITQIPFVLSSHIAHLVQSFPFSVVNDGILGWTTVMAGRVPPLFFGYTSGGSGFEGLMEWVERRQLNISASQLRIEANNQSTTITSLQATQEIGVEEVSERAAYENIEEGTQVEGGKLKNNISLVGRPPVFGAPPRMWLINNARGHTERRKPRLMQRRSVLHFPSSAPSCILPSLKGR